MNSNFYKYPVISALSISRTPHKSSCYFLSFLFQLHLVLYTILRCLSRERVRRTPSTTTLSSRLKIDYYYYLWAVVRFDVTFVLGNLIPVGAVLQPVIPFSFLFFFFKLKPFEKFEIGEAKFFQIKKIFFIFSGADRIQLLSPIG